MKRMIVKDGDTICCLSKGFIIHHADGTSTYYTTLWQRLKLTVQKFLSRNRNSKSGEIRNETPLKIVR